MNRPDDASTMHDQAAGANGGPLPRSGPVAAQDRQPLTRGSAPARVLVADDQPDVLEALRLLLKSEGYQIDAASSPATPRWTRPRR